MKKGLIFVMIIFTAGFVFSEGEKKLDLDVETSVAMALKNNLGIERSRIKLEQYTWAMATSWNKFVPDTKLGFSMTHIDDQSMAKKYPQVAVTDELSKMPTGLPGNAPLPSNIYNYVYSPEIPSWNVGMNLNVSLNLNAAMIFGVYQTVLDWQSGKLSLESAEKKMNKDVRKSYYMLLIFKENLNILNEKMDSAKKRYEQAAVNRMTGVSTKIDELAAKAAYENLKPAYLEMENSYKQAVLNFKQMIGLKDEVDPNLTAKIPDVHKYEFNLNDLLKKYMNNKLEVQSLNFSLKSLRNQRNMNISGLTPSFFFSYVYDPIYMKDPFDSKNSNWFSDVNNDWIEKSGYFTLGFSIPLSSMLFLSQEQMRLVNTEFAIKDTNKSLEQLKLDTKSQIQSILLNIDKSYKSIETLKLNIELSQEVYSMTSEAYRLGTKQLLQVEDAENELNNAKLNLMKQQYDYASNLLELEYSLNVKLSELFKNKNEEKK